MGYDASIRYRPQFRDEHERNVKILVGLVLAGVATPTSWWAFQKAARGEDFYNWIWVIGLVVAVFGITTVIAQLVKWMKS